ncbi:hypothetical protein Tco_0862006 [Tanacetum coccineum]
MPITSAGRRSMSPSEHPDEENSLDASAKLTRAELNKRFKDADLSKDKSGLESPPKFQRSWYVKGHIRHRVISSVPAQRHLRNSPTKGTILAKDYSLCLETKDQAPEEQS